MKESELVIKAHQAKEKAYAPYSKFRVGAALITKKGLLYTGCNIENATYGATICAERTAVCKAVSDVDCQIEAIAIAGDSEDYIYPCGICRQVLAEFGTDEMKVICSNKNGEYKIHTLGELLPQAFRGENLDKG